MKVPLEPSITLLPLQLNYMDYLILRYGFEDPSEVVRHLIFNCNLESTETKKIVFRKIRCYHCKTGGRDDKVPITFQDADHTIEVYAFQKLWVDKVLSSCNIPSYGKFVRILFDYYMGVIKSARPVSGLIKAGVVETAATEEGAAADDEGTILEKSIFIGTHREHDSRVSLAQKIYLSTLELEKPTDKSAPKILSSEMESEPGACSASESEAAMRTCQVGRGSGSYALALNETSDETASRRLKEEEYEQSDEMKQRREVIRKALGSVMG
jgi:hypothetical protein